MQRLKMILNDEGELIEKGSGHVTSHDQNGHVTSHALPDSPPTLQQRIFIVVAQSGRGVTRREIAKAVGLKSTGWLNGKIDGMVSDGYLCREHGHHTNGVMKYLYVVAKRDTKRYADNIPHTSFTNNNEDLS